MMGDNVVYDVTDGREFTFIINGQNYFTESLILTGDEEIEEIEFEVIDEPEEILEIRYWSNENHWGEDGSIPVEGDEVIILSDWIMVYDI